MMEVEYKLIEGYPDYRVGSDGSVWTSKATTGSWGKVRTGDWRIMHPRKHRGRTIITVRKNGKQKQFNMENLMEDHFGIPYEG